MKASYPPKDLHTSLLCRPVCGLQPSLVERTRKPYTLSVNKVTAREIQVMKGEVHSQLPGSNFIGC